MEDSGPVVADEKLMEGSKDVAIGGSELVLKHVNSLKIDLFRKLLVYHVAGRVMELPSQDILPGGGGEPEAKAHLVNASNSNANT